MYDGSLFSAKWLLRNYAECTQCNSQTITAIIMLRRLRLSRRLIGMVIAVFLQVSRNVCNIYACKYAASNVRVYDRSTIHEGRSFYAQVYCLCVWSRSACVCVRTNSSCMRNISVIKAVILFPSNVFLHDRILFAPNIAAPQDRNYRHLLLLTFSLSSRKYLIRLKLTDDC